MYFIQASHRLATTAVICPARVATKVLRLVIEDKDEESLYAVLFLGETIKEAAV